MRTEREYTWEFHGQLIHLYERDIYYIHSEQRKTFVHTKDRTYRIGLKLSEGEKYLGEMPVLRIHCSYLIHLRHLESVRGQEVTLRNGERLPISKNRKKMVHEAVRRYFRELKKCREKG